MANVLINNQDTYINKAFIISVTKKVSDNNDSIYVLIMTNGDKYELESYSYNYFMNEKLKFNEPFDLERYESIGGRLYFLNNNKFIPKPLDGGSAYESWLNQGNTGTEEDFINQLRSVFKSEFISTQSNGDLLYGWYDSKNELISTYIVPKGDIGYSGIPGVNYDGTFPEYPDIPMDVPYGTVMEVAPGTVLPNGWVYANGSKLSKGKYPHLVGKLNSIVVPETSEYIIDRSSVFTTVSTPYGTGYNVLNSLVTMWKDTVSDDLPEISSSVKSEQRYVNYLFNRNTSTSNDRYIQMLNVHRGTSEFKQYPLNISLTEELYIHRIAFDKRFLTSRILDLQVNIGGEWTTFERVYQTDMIPDHRYPDTIYHVIKNRIPVNEFRISLSEENSEFNYTVSSSGVTGCGFAYMELHMGKNPMKYNDVITLPYETDSSGNFKIIHVGQQVK